MNNERVQTIKDLSNEARIIMIKGMELLTVDEMKKLVGVNDELVRQIGAIAGIYTLLFNVTDIETHSRVYNTINAADEIIKAIFKENDFRKKSDGIEKVASDLEKVCGGLDKTELYTVNGILRCLIYVLRHNDPEVLTILLMAISVCISEIDGIKNKDGIGEPLNRMEI